ncbi:MAG: hydrolase [Verrucomicrobia bacterium]|nr:hydrolase [Verrucomicrobiota bacterium]
MSYRVVVFGDSNSWGFIPNPAPPSERYPFDKRWPGRLKLILGDRCEVIEEALNGRTTDITDPQLPGAGLNGSEYLPAALSSHHPVDLLIIALGANDLKAAYNRTPLRIALGAGRLIDIANTIGGGIGTPYSSPKTLLVCPAPLNPCIQNGREFGPMFKGAVEKSRQLGPLYESIAKLGGAQFLDAGSCVTIGTGDGLHLGEKEHEGLAQAVATKVQEMFSQTPWGS